MLGFDRLEVRMSRTTLTEPFQPNYNELAAQYARLLTKRSEYPLHYKADYEGSWQPHQRRQAGICYQPKENNQSHYSRDDKPLVFL